jgi:hypothetical protein
MDWAMVAHLLLDGCVQEIAGTTVVAALDLIGMVEIEQGFRSAW